MTTTDKKLYIFGAGGHGKVVADAAQMSGVYTQFVFADADPALTGLSLCGINIIAQNEGIEALQSANNGEAIIAIGDNAVRGRLADQLREASVEVVSIQHPLSAVASTATLGIGSVVMAGAVLQADAQVGEGAILNTRCSVDHDCRLGKFVHCGPGSTVCGNVTVGDMTFIGAGATVIPGITIGARAVIGAGAVVIRDVPDDSTVIGVPARLSSTGPVS